MQRSPAAGAASSAVPLELTSFIGREHELAALREIIAASRLITLTGAGGSGKSRLARELAPHIPGVRDSGIVWVELAPVTDPSLVGAAILRALDPAAEQGANVAAVISGILQDRSPVLVLDNCEHVVDACATLVDTLLRACPGLRILATSREALAVPGERAWLVPPLGLPPANATPVQVATSDAVRLFVERAQDVMPAFNLTATNAAVVADICVRLDGIPLAIELAAARVRLMTPEQIRDRLDDAFTLLTSGARTALPRHRTLRAAIDWSYDLLPAPARTVLCRLAVFRGGFTLDAAEAVAAGDAVDPGDVLDLVSMLLDRSLLSMREQDGTARYLLLETMRQYAGANLDDADERNDAMRAMTRHYVAFIGAEEPSFTTTQRRRAFARVDPELDNIREVLAWSHGHDHATHVRLVGLLWWYWFGSRHWVEAARWIQGALALPAGMEPGRDRAMLLFAGGALACLQAQVPSARAQLHESVELARQAGDQRLEAYALNYLGMSHAQVGSPEAREYSGRAEAWFRPNGDLYGLRLALLLQGMGAAAAGDTSAARRLMEEAVAIARSFGQDRELGIALQTLAGVVYAEGDSATAEALLVEAVAALKRDWNYLFVGRAVDFLGVLAAAYDPREAARRLGAGDALREHVGAARFHLDQQRVDAATATLRQQLGAEFDQWYRTGRHDWGVVVDGIVAPPGPAAAARAREPGPQAAPVSPVASSPPAIGQSAATPVGEGDREPIGRVDAAPADLHVILFGPVQVKVRGVPVDDWPYAKPRELLAFLLAHPRGRTRVEIGAALWPDAAPAQLRNSFHVTLHHLRKTLGRPEWIVIENDRYRIAPDVSIATDVAVFEALVRSVMNHEGAVAPHDAMLRLDQALRLYTDHYLAGESSGRWRDDEQDRLRAVYTEAALRLGAMREAAGDMAAALATYETLLAHEPLLEEAHRRLITYWSQAGDRPRAVRHYERLAARLMNELGLEPDPETMALYEQVRGLPADQRPVSG
ncbi:MAG TPA: BTAD domain-containing putative transcriptional regulator [Longimicrobiales bacterium]|nr:BTAD domain-containing putative transcriptional regulator [Longimicrobiales bacterium]